ncbi:methionine--tRNA ligase, cytoplasmic-like [Saccoglossus kowalevskii]|uniref:Methionine--tRNA ligase, cytoplasmic-like n=1 Tax=Saccoglossus kowalevskii TaxID=10224 RepID=A0ABM0M344_SACKO|nr:PREDICTED: methionine--tRNA ligase, cytoplasmic-like [Saccoglossus kowalevskii]
MYLESQLDLLLAACALVFCDRNFNGEVPVMDLNDDDKQLLAMVNRELQTYIQCLNKARIRDGLRTILNISRLGNQHIQANMPWKLIKGSEEEKIRAGTVTGLSVNISCLISVLLQPYLPNTSDEIQKQLQAPDKCNLILDQFVCFIPPGHKIGQGGVVRTLKTAKADKVKIEAEVKKLLELKRQLSLVKGEDPAPSSGGKGKNKK